MTSAIQLFNYEQRPVRTVVIDGKIWFVAKDVCDILGYSNVTDALNNHLDEDERNTLAIREGNRGNPVVNIINQSGLFCLILRSNQPQAKKFRRWVTEIVLPQVITNGLPENPEHQREKFSMELFNAARAIHEMAGIKDNQLVLVMDKITQHLTGYSMLALSGTVLVAPSNCQLLTPTELGKHFGVSARKMNEILCSNGYQKREGNGYEPLEGGEPYAVMLDTGKQHSDGTPIRQLKWESSFITEIEDLFTQEAQS